MDDLTIEEMRAEIFKVSFEDSLVRSVMDTADYTGMSSEARYTLLAYHFMKHHLRYKEMLLHHLSLTPAPKLEL